MLAALTGAMLAAGLIALLIGLFPPKPDLAAQLAVFSDDPSELLARSNSSAFDSYALMLLETVKGDKLETYEADVLVIGSDMQTMARDKAKAAGAGGFLFGSVAVLLGWINNPLGLLVAIALGCMIGYNVTDIELKSKAAARRNEFSEALTAFMTLLSSSISGGSGITTSLSDAAAMGDGWVFDHIRAALNDARIDGTSAWLALERLGQKLQVIPLIELAGSLTLAGTSGARVTETLVSRAASSREKELSAARADAESKSSKLGVPVGMIMMTWVFFIGFPAMQTVTSF